MRVVCLDFWNFENYTIELANIVSQKKDIQVLMIAPQEYNREFTKFLRKDVRTHFFKRRQVYSPLNIFLMRTIIKWILEFDPDLIHIQFGHPWFCPILPVITRKYPIVTTFHDVRPHLGEDTLSKRLVFKCMAKYSNQIIVHGHRLRNELIELYRLPRSKVHVLTIPSALAKPFKMYENKGVEEEPFSVLFFGRIREYKGLEYLLRAAPILFRKASTAKIIIAGAGNFEEYEKMITDRERYELHIGHISYKMGAKLFQRCSICVLPYVEGSQSGVIPVAYAFCKPVVTTKVGSIPEIVDNAMTGYLVPPRKPTALTDAIIKLLDDKARKQMGIMAHKKLESELTWGESTLAKIIDIYEVAVKRC